MHSDRIGRRVQHKSQFVDLILIQFALGNIFQNDLD